MKKHPTTRGFTLIELSIIILIIAIFLAGIVMSSDLMRSSKLLKILVQVDEFNKAVKVFQEKYKELPGDLSNAETFWGSDATCPGTAYTATPHSLTCNGDGNTHIGDFFTDAGATSNESYRAWQHLANANMLGGGYVGMSGTGSVNHAIPGVNVPKGYLKGTGFTLMYMFLPGGNADYWPMMYGHVFIYGAKTTNTVTNGPNMTPKEAFLLDQKIDDGKPGTGRVVTSKITLAMPNCITSNIANTAEYNFSYAFEACSFIFITGY